MLVQSLSVHLVVLPAQDKQQDGRQQDSAVKGSTGPPAKFFAAPDADISSDETHPQPPLKADLSDGPAFEAPAKSGGSELFDALLMAATGKHIVLQCWCGGPSWFGSCFPVQSSATDLLRNFICPVGTQGTCIYG